MKTPSSKFVKVVRKLDKKVDFRRFTKGMKNTKVQKAFNLFKLKN